MRCARERPAGSRDLRLQLESGGGRAGFVKRASPDFRARGSLLRRARDLPDRYRRLRGHPAPRDDAARADGHPQFVRTSLRARQQSGDRADRRSAAEHRSIPPARRADGLHRCRASRESDDDLARQAYRAQDVRAQGIDWDRAEAGRMAAAQRARGPTRRLRNGHFPTRSGKCEFWSETLARAGPGSAARLPCRRANRRHPTRSSRVRYPLGFISPPARNFLNSSFSHLPAFVAEEKTPHLDIHPRDAAPRGIGARRSGARVQRSRQPARRRRASPTARALAWSSRHRCGGASSRPVARTPTR